MKFEELVAVTGMPGLHRMISNRSNGLVVEDLATGKRTFASARKHNFSALATIGIYTDEDTMELRKVMDAMKEQLETNPPVADTASKDELFGYFGKVLPGFDRERVYPNDIKKLIKWFNIIKERDLLSLLDQPEPSNAEQEVEAES